MFLNFGSGVSEALSLACSFPDNSSCVLPQIPVRGMVGKTGLEDLGKYCAYAQVTR